MPKPKILSVYDQLDQLKKFLKTSGIKVNLVDLLKGINKVFLHQKQVLKLLNSFSNRQEAKRFKSDVNAFEIYYIAMELKAK